LGQPGTSSVSTACTPDFNAAKGCCPDGTGYTGHSGGDPKCRPKINNGATLSHYDSDLRLTVSPGGEVLDRSNSEPLLRGGVSAVSNYFYITRISPTRGPKVGGTQLRIRGQFGYFMLSTGGGTGCTQDPRVTCAKLICRFHDGSTRSADVTPTWATADTLVCETPATTAGTYDRNIVGVGRAGQEVTTLTSKEFRWDSQTLVVNGVSPTHGPVWVCRQHCGGRDFV
jgi:hypothetical protein